MGDEVDAWHATIAIDRALRHSHRTRLSGARRVGRGADGAARRDADGMALPDPDVTHVARAAAEIARGMVAGDECRGRSAPAAAALVRRSLVRSSVRSLTTSPTMLRAAS